MFKPEEIAAEFQPSNAHGEVFGWDCDPFFVASNEVSDYDEGLNEEDDEGDWQVLALDRFGDVICFDWKVDDFKSRGE